MGKRRMLSMARLPVHAMTRPWVRPTGRPQVCPMGKRLVQAMARLKNRTGQQRPGNMCLLHRAPRKGQWPGTEQEGLPPFLTRGISRQTGTGQAPGRERARQRRAPCVQRAQRQKQRVWESQRPLRPMAVTTCHPATGCRPPITMEAGPRCRYSSARWWRSMVSMRPRCRRCLRG